METKIKQPRIKYYSELSITGQIFYYAVHPDGRVQVTVERGGWVSYAMLELPIEAIPCLAREAVDGNGKHPIW